MGGVQVPPGPRLRSIEELLQRVDIEKLIRAKLNRDRIGVFFP